MIQTLKERLQLGVLYLFGLIVICALAFQLFFLTLEFSGNGEYASQIARELTWKFDGTFKNTKPS